MVAGDQRSSWGREGEGVGLGGLGKTWNLTPSEL